MAELRLNLGCHRWPLKGFVNIDLDPVFAYDLQADCLHLPYEDNSVDEIYAGHLLEHTTLEENALKEWHRVLKPGGLITITVPEIQACLDWYRNGGCDLAFLQGAVFGGQDRVEQNHHQLFTKDILLSQMRLYFPDTEIIPETPLAVANVPWQTIGQGHKP